MYKSETQVTIQQNHWRQFASSNREFVEVAVQDAIESGWQVQKPIRRSWFGFGNWVATVKR